MSAAGCRARTSGRTGRGRSPARPRCGRCTSSGCSGSTCGRIISAVTVICGIAGWVDKSLIDSKLFYPLSVKTSGDRLRFYASQFSLVEGDSTYYGIPKPESGEAWAAQTPDGFVFDVKSFSLFTNHPTRPLNLPPDIRADL